MKPTLVAGYDSDSASEDESKQPVKPPSLEINHSSSLKHALPPPKSSSLASSLPPPRSTSTTAITGGLSLPTPKNTSSSRPVKRKGGDKFQIKIGSLDQLDEEGSDLDNSEPKLDERNESRNKRPKSDVTHSLFGMLPAPKRTDQQIKQEKQKEEQQARQQGAINLYKPSFEAEDETDSPDQDDQPQSSQANKGKVNSDFRAMLGLKPTASKPNTAKPAETTKPSKPSFVASTATKNEETNDSLLAPASSPSKNQAKSDSQALDFFSLGVDSVSQPSVPSLSSLSMPELNVSLAPTVDEPSSSSQQNDSAHVSTSASSLEYPGWQQDPDGTWVPITPEAQAAYASWQTQAETQAAFDNPSSRRKNNGVGFDLAEMAKAGFSQDELVSVDAGDLARQVWQNQPLDSLNDKYAMAASQVAAAAAASNSADQQAVPHQPQRSGPKDLKRGQLSSLFAHATEKRSGLEEKWARGRASRHDAGNRPSILQLPRE